MILKVIGASFNTRPKRRKLENSKDFIFDTHGEFLVTCEGIKNPYRKFEIPMGFICDSTSIPYVNKDSAADAHDFLYCRQGIKQGYDRLFCDKVFYYLMLDIGMPKWRARVRYQGVRLFGGLPYRKRTYEKHHFLKMKVVSKLIPDWRV